MKSLLFFNYTDRGKQYREKLGEKGFKILSKIFKKIGQDN